MQLIRHLTNTSILPNTKLAITIGNFDGIHLGHQKLLQDIKDNATTNNISSAVILFEPQTNEFFTNYATPRLLKLRDKLRILQQYEIDYVICLKFTTQLAHTTAEDFINDTLIKQLHMQYLCIGNDFQFGANKISSQEILFKICNLHNIKVTKLPDLLINATRVSSTMIREYLNNGQISLAEQMLGRPYAVSGRVLHGQQLGRTINVRTANLRLFKHNNIALRGVFAVKVKLVDSQQEFFGVANIGVRPTVDGVNALLEAHLLNFNQDIYGKIIIVTILHKIRNEVKFANIEQLKNQLQQDIKNTQDFFNTEFRI